MSFFDKFLIATRFDLRALFVRYQAFLLAPFESIKNYYLTQDSVLPNAAFTELLALEAEAERAVRTFGTYKTALREEAFVDLLLDKTQDMLFYLKTVPLLPRLLRLSKISLANKQIVVNRSLELFADTQTGNRDNWVNLAIRNDLFETDYDKNTPLLLDKVQRQYNLTSVTDTIDSESVLGRDLPTSLSLTDDFEVLTPQETLTQTVGILASLVRNQNPNFPNLGSSKEILLSNIHSLMQATIPRQIITNFKSDDSFSSVSVDELAIEDGTAKVALAVTTISGQVENDNVLIAL